MISVIVPSVRTGTVTEAIAAIQKQTYQDWELIVSDQSGSDAIRQVIENFHDPRLRHIVCPGHGVSRARNVGVSQARGEYLAFTDDDCEADPHWLQILVECFAADSEVGLVSGALIAPKPLPGRFYSCPFFMPSDALYDPAATGNKSPKGWGWVGANFALRRSTFKEIGEFDPQIGAGTLYPAGEDTDYNLRLESAGVRMRSTPEAVVLHTYGHRYGLKALLRHSENYARGNGSVAAKLTLQGDPRGAEWVKFTQRSWIEPCLRQGKWHRLFFSLRSVYYFMQAYHRCLREYQIDSQTPFLRLRTVNQTRPPAKSVRLTLLLRLFFSLIE